MSYTTFTVTHWRFWSSFLRETKTKPEDHPSTPFGRWCILQTWDTFSGSIGMSLRYHFLHGLVQHRWGRKVQVRGLSFHFFGNLLKSGSTVEWYWYIFLGFTVGGSTRVGRSLDTLYWLVTKFGDSNPQRRIRRCLITLFRWLNVVSLWQCILVVLCFFPWPLDSQFFLT